MKRLLRAGTTAASALLSSKPTSLQVGNPAPAFTAVSTSGEIRLEQALETGPVVLAFFYADFTAG